MSCKHDNCDDCTGGDCGAMEDDFEKIIERLRAAHLRFPTLRFLQLIWNVCPYDTFYVENKDFTEYITEYMENPNGS